MKNFSLLLVICLLLCSCAGWQEEAFEESQSVTVSETTEATSEVTEAAAEPVVTERSAVSETETTVDELVLTPIPSDKPLDVLECRFYDSFWTESVERFYNKDILAYAKEICFADEYVHSEIEFFNSDLLSGDSAVFKVDPIETAEDIGFVSGGGYDFDGDGEEEYLICMNYSPYPVDGSGFLVYIDGSDYKILEKGINAAADASVITAGEYEFIMINTGYGAIGYTYDIYGFENGMPKKVFDIENNKFYTFRDNFFCCEIKYDDMLYPFVLCTDGVFRQLACEKITPEDFVAHMSGGKEYLDSLAENGEEILEIYTYGYFSYKLYGYDFDYSVIDYNGGYNCYRHEYSKPYDGQPPVREFTDELVHGADVWAVRGVPYVDADIGGGYTLYAVREKNNTFTLCAADKNGITDSMEISDKNLEHLSGGRYNDRNRSLYPGFYDFDVPPCFSLEHENENAVLLYDTYFIVDGKFRQGEWILDGEKQDGIDYTMLTCYGKNENEFVSYSTPHYNMDDKLEPLIRRNFTFDRENLRFEGHSETYPEPTGDAAIAAEVFKKYGEFVDGLNNGKFGEPYDPDNNYWLYKYEEEGYRTRTEIMESLREFCTESLAEQFYSYYITESGDLEEFDGVIYHYDGPPNVYSIKYIDSAEKKDGAINARVYSYMILQDIPFRIEPPMYAKIVQEDGVWKLDSFPLKGL